MHARAWRVIAWMCAAHVASMAGFSTYATLLPRLQHAWSLNNSQAGFISGAFFAGYMASFRASWRRPPSRE